MVRQRNRKRKKRLRRIKAIVSYFAKLVLVIGIFIFVGFFIGKYLEQKYFDDEHNILKNIAGYFDNPSTELLLKLGYPESLVTLYEKNEEARDFVLGYFSKNDEADIDISGEVKVGEIPEFLQWDSRWGYRRYGSDFLAITGCGPTCLSMVYCGLTGDTQMNPYKMGQLAEEKGYYVPGAGTSWSMMTDLATSLGLKAEEMVCDEYNIKNTLLEGNPIICVMGPGRFTTEGHFIVLTEVTEDGRIRIHDPNSPANSDMTWDVGELMSETYNLWCYSY